MYEFKVVVKGDMCYLSTYNEFYNYGENYYEKS